MSESLEEMYRDHSRRVYCYLLSLSHDPALSDDLMQDTFLKAARNIDQFRHDSSLSSWLCSIAKNLYRDWLRKQKPSVPVEDMLLTHQDDRRDLRIFSCLHQLEEPYREIVYLRTFCSMSFREIGEILSHTDTWCRVMYSRGRQKLQTLWLKEENQDEKR